MGSRIVKAILIIVMAIVLGSTVLFFLYYWTSYKSADNTFANIINEGNDFMSAEKYLEAINKYESALELEPENAELRKALGHAYVCYAGTIDDGDSKVAAYQNALMYNKLNTNAYWGMVDFYEGMDDEESVLMTLQTGYAETQDDNMKIKADNIEAERARIKAEEEEAAREEAERLALIEYHDSMLNPLKEMFESEDMDLDAIKDLLRTDKYVSFADEVIGDDNSFYSGDLDETGLRNGKGIAVYANGYYYYGDFVNDLREGHGIYIRAVYTENSSLGSYMYDGEWMGDMPNGKGVATSNFYKDKISSAELVKQIIEGEYSSGLENGTMTLNGTKKGGGSVNYTYKVKDGVAEKSSNEDSGVKGQYIIAKSKDGKSNLTSDGSKRGIEGFIE